MTTLRRVFNAPTLRGGLILLVMAWSATIAACGWAASPITPERPIPALSEAAAALSQRLAQCMEDRQAILGELELLRRNAIAEYDAAMAVPGRIEQASPSVARLAQVALWRAALLAEAPVAQPKAGELPFTGRDELAWYAAILHAAGEQESADAIVGYAKIPADATELVAAILAAPETDRGAAFAPIEQRLADDPKDPGVAMAVEMVLRRRVGPADQRAELWAAAQAVGDQAASSLKAYVAAVNRGERVRALEAMVGSRTFRVAGVLADGSPFDPGALNGKAVIVAFWAPQNSKCLMDLRRLVKLYEEHRSSGLEIVSVVSVQGANNIQEFLARHPEVTWPQLIDASAARNGMPHPLAVESGVANFPTYFAIDRQGVLRSIDAGADLATIVGALVSEK